MKKFIVTPYVIDLNESRKAGVAVIDASNPKVIEADTSIGAAVKHRPPRTTFWHVRKMVD